MANKAVSNDSTCRLKALLTRWRLADLGNWASQLSAASPAPSAGEVLA